MDSLKHEASSSILFLGEGNFSFTVSFLEKHWATLQTAGWSVVPTELRTLSELAQDHPEFVKKLDTNLQALAEKKIFPLFRIDAGAIADYFGSPYQRLKIIMMICPYPACGHQKEAGNQLSLLQFLLRSLFKSATKKQHLGDCVCIGIPFSDDTAQNTRKWYSYYELNKASFSSGYHPIGWFLLQEGGKPCYQGYEFQAYKQSAQAHGEKATANLRCYIFEKTQLLPEAKQQQQQISRQEIDQQKPLEIEALLKKLGSVEEEDAKEEEKFAESTNEVESLISQLDSLKLSLLQKTKKKT